jgi:hypothetical protein
VRLRSPDYSLPDPAWSQTEVNLGEGYLVRCLELARRSGPPWAVYFSQMRMGDLQRLRGNLELAEALLTESLALTDAAGDNWSRSRCLLSLGLVKLAGHALFEAQRLLRASLALALELQDQRGIIYALDGLASAAAGDGRAEWAARLFGHAEALRATIGSVLSASFDSDRQRGIDSARDQLGEAAFAQAWASGREVPLDELATIV